jgi:hypothetical protein
MMRVVKISRRDFSTARIPGWLERCGLIAFWLLCVLALAAIALEFGAWRSEFHLTGPFAAEAGPAQHALVLSVPSEGAVPWWRQPLNADSPEKPFESRLHLRIAGRDMGPAHAELDTIGEGTSEAFSHRGSSVVFSLPPGLPNSAETTVTLWYSVRARPAVSFAILASTVLLGAPLYRAWLLWMIRRLRDAAAEACRDSSRVVPWLISAPYVVLAAVASVGMVGVILFAGAAVVAWWQGWALPTTAPLRWFATIAWAARNEPHWGHLLLTVAGLGTLSSWLAIMSGREKLSRELEESTLRWLKWCSLPLGVCALLLCTSAMWDGMLRAGDPHWASIGGLIPYSDAEGHLAAAFEEARDGTLSAFAQRRPIAASLRSVLLLVSGYSTPRMLMLQACLVAVAACWAACAVMRWRGVWAGLAFFGFVYMFARTFTPTMLTEPLGLFCALLSIPFLVEALRAHSARAGLVGLAIVSIALMVRMGAMFTIPALMIWLICCYGRGVASKARLLILAMVAVGCIGATNIWLSKAFGTQSGEVGGNFSYIVCGLTIGTTWVGCPEKLAEQGTPLSGDEANIAPRLYAMAWHNFLDRPDVFFRRIGSGVALFVEGFPAVLWFGYGAAIGNPAWLFPKVLTAIILVGLACFARRRADRTEFAFWSLLWASILMSAALIYYDDGARTLAVSQPAIALFAAIGMMNPALAIDVRPAGAGLVRWGVGGVVFGLILFAAAPWIAHRVPPVGNGLAYASQANQSEALVFGAPQLSGFLVVDNDQPLRADVPTFHLDVFETIVKQAGIDQGLLQPTRPSTPFGFVFAPRLERQGGPEEFIVPAEMMHQPNVRAWRLTIEPLQPGSTQWFRASSAEAWPARGDR